MDVFKSKVVRRGSDVLYILLTFMSFYCAGYRMAVGVKYGVNLVFVGWALAAFFIRPMMDRGIMCVRLFAMFFFPYLVFWIWSVGIWILHLQTFDYILRGSLNVFYMLTNLMFTAAAVYLFGRRTMFLSIISMALANAYIGLEVARSDGIGKFIAEYIRLVLTFANDTGGTIRKMELHDLVYGWGVCLVYYFIHKEKNHKEQLLCIAISAVFFTMGFKRIAVPAIVGAIAMYHFFNKVKPKNLHRLATIAGVATGLAAFGYLWFIKSGLFVKLAKQYGINLMYRDVIYNYFSNFFELSPAYLGRGIRFIYNFTTTDPSFDLAAAAVHNVYMELYIETGFWCWWIWILFELTFRVHRIAERYTDNSGYVVMAMNLYVFFTYLTDNTSFYFVINVFYHMAIMIFCCEKIESEGIANPEMLSTFELNAMRRQNASMLKNEKERRQ